MWGCRPVAPAARHERFESTHADDPLDGDETLSEQAKPPLVRGETARRGGHGLGLTIVRRLSDRFGWPVTIDSSPGVGTRVEIRFPGARREPLYD